MTVEHKKEPKKPKWKPIAPFPWAMQRYPHTYFNDRDGVPKFMDYVTMVMGIYRNWEMSLTELLGKLDQQETEDVDGIVIEITNLIAKIQYFNDTLAREFKNLFAAESAYLTKNNEAHSGTVAMIIDGCVNLTQVMDGALKDILNCIESHLMEHDQYIGTIFNRLTDIDAMLYYLYYRIQEIPEVEPYDDQWIRDAFEQIIEILERLLSKQIDEYTLTEGVDYSIEYYNGFSDGKDYVGDSTTVGGKPIITRQRTVFTDLKNVTTFTDDIIISCKSNNCIGNSDTIKASAADNTDKQVFRFKHSSSISQEPKSKICTITFLNNNTGDNNTRSFAYSDNDYVQTVQEGNNIWNMRLQRCRASWGVDLNYSFNGGNLTLAANSINDGFNQQYYSYFDSNFEGTSVAIKQGELKFGLLNMTSRATFVHQM